jgi:ParB family transcriptional regulator, chromosome partitioning protein
MLPQICYKYLPVEVFQDSLYWNLHPFLDSLIPENLQSSIEKVGILHPPIVLQTDNGNFDIICGRKRIQCAQALAKSPVFCRILLPTLPKNQILALLLEDQLCSGPLSPVEMAKYLQLCLDHIEHDKVLNLLPGDVGHGKNRSKILSDLLRLLELDFSLQRKIHSGLIVDSVIKELLNLPPEERNRIVYLIDHLQLGGGKQKRLFSLCRDITLRENISICTLLDQQKLQEVIDHRQMNIPQKTNRLLGLLQKRCYPQSTAARESFQTHVQGFDLPGTCDINPSPYFEKDEVTLSIRFSDLEECRRIWPSLKRVLPKNL